MLGDARYHLNNKMYNYGESNMSSLVLDIICYYINNNTHY